MIRDTKAIQETGNLRAMRDVPPSTPPRLIVVDDDASVRDALRDYLGRNGFRVRTADGALALDRLLVAMPADLVVLDLMMPGEDGLSVCRRLAAQGQPVLMLSAMGEAVDRIVGLELGAADYLAKPFEPRELLARIRAVLRRNGPTNSHRSIFLFDGWTLDPSERLLWDPAGLLVALTSGEHRLLRAFLERPLRLLTRDQLMDLARGETAEAFDRSIDLAVSRLRRKLDRSGCLIETVRGEGYRFVGQVECT